MWRAAITAERLFMSIGMIDERRGRLHPLWRSRIASVGALVPRVPTGAPMTVDEIATWSLLEKILAGVPKLDTPACGPSTATLFDRRGPDEDRDDAEARHHRALNLCRTCPALDACRNFAQYEKPSGQVIAGRSPLIT